MKLSLRCQNFGIVRKTEKKVANETVVWAQDAVLAQNCTGSLYLPTDPAMICACNLTLMGKALRFQ